MSAWDRDLEIAPKGAVDFGEVLGLPTPKPEVMPELGSAAPIRKGKERNRVIYWVTAVLDSPAEAMGKYLWETRPKFGDHPEPGMKVQTYAAEGNVLKLVIDYTVKGGNPHDIWRDDDQRPGMLDRVAKRLGVKVMHADCDERSRVPVEDAEMPSDGS